MMIRFLFATTIIIAALFSPNRAFMTGRVIELGETIKNSDFVNISGVTIDDLKLEEGARMKVNYLALDMGQAEVTKVQYTADVLPFSAQGCLLVYYLADVSQIVTKKDIEDIDLSQKWSIVIFGEKVKQVDRAVIDELASSSAIIGTFKNQNIPAENLKEILERGGMVISNLVKNPSLGDESKQFRGYVLFYDILNRPMEMPVLANLVLVDFDPENKACEPAPGRTMEIVSHDFKGQLPLHPVMKYPEIIGTSNLFFPEHYGTHLDAPSHMFEDGATVDQLMPEMLLTPCVRIHDYNLTGEDMLPVERFREWEARTGYSIPDGSLVFLDTGMNKQWPHFDQYYNINPDTKQARILGIDPEAARWLVEDRKISAIAIDSSSTDSSVNPLTWPTHVELAKGGILGIENLGSTEKLPNLFLEPRRKPVSTCLMVYLRIEGGTGSPVAIFGHTDGYLSDVYDDVEVMDGYNSGTMLYPKQSIQYSILFFLTILLFQAR